MVLTAASMPCAIASASTSTSARWMSGVNTNGRWICGSGSRSDEPRDLLALDVVALFAERGRVREVFGLAGRDEAVELVRVAR